MRLSTVGTGVIDGISIGTTVGVDEGDRAAAGVAVIRAVLVLVTVGVGVGKATLPR